MPNAAPLPRRVLIAGVSTRAAAESAARAGFDVVSLDAFADLDQAPGVRARALPRDFGVRFSATAAARASRTLECDAVAYLSSFENHPAAVGTLARGRTLLGNSPAVLRRVRDPDALARALTARRVACADVVDAPPVESNEAWLRKPRASGGGHGIRAWLPGEPVARSTYLQRHIEGTPGSIAFVAARGAAALLGLTSQIVGDRNFGATGFRYCGSVLAPADDPQFGRDRDLLTQCSRIATVLAAEFDLVGVNGVDFVARDGTPVVVEVNPRYSASMELVERAYGISVFGTHADACVSGTLPTFDLAAARSSGTAIGKAILFARHDTVCGDTRPWLDDPDIRDIPHPGERIQAGRPVCTVLARGAGARACYARLVTRAARLYAVLDSWATVLV